MRRKKTAELLTLLLLFIALCPFSNAEAGKPEELIGDDVLLFTLPSNQDRTISYGKEYYGKYHLIMTFFPAAYTPI